MLLKRIFYKLTSNVVFIIEVKNSRVKNVSGIEHIRFMEDCADVVKETDLKRGLIYAVKASDGRILIKTSGEVSPQAAQRLRNLWSFYS